MPTLKKDALFDLITSLTKAEKRNFRIYAKKIQSGGEVLFLKLFDYLEKQEQYDVNELLKNLKNIKKSQIPNLKRNLYQHILTSLRLLYSQKQIGLQIREFINDAEILYNKGLYLQALKILGRAKKIAQKNHQSILHVAIVAFEGKIESRHITRSSTQRMSDLMLESKLGNQVIANVSKLANLKLYLQRVFIIEGHLKTVEVKTANQLYFNSLTKDFKIDKATFFEKVFYYQSCYWYHFLLQEFQFCHDYANRWVQLYEAEANMITTDVDMYLRAKHHLLNTTFFIKEEEKLKEEVKHFRVFVDTHTDQFSLNALVQSYLFLYQAQFNLYFLGNQFEQGLTIIPKVLVFINKYEYQLDNYKIMILYYKIASCYLGAGQPEQTIDFVNLIINQSGNALREDILRFSRLLGILAHYELKNMPSLEYLLNATERQLRQSNQPDKLSQITIIFFKKIMYAIPRTKPQLFKDFHQAVTNLAQQIEEGRAFIFLDMLGWVDRQID